MNNAVIGKLFPVIAIVLCISIASPSHAQGLSREEALERVKQMWAPGLVEQAFSPIDVPYEYWSDPAFALEALRIDVKALAGISSKLLDDRQFIISAMEIDPALYKGASHRLKKDKALARIAFQKEPKNRAFIADVLRDDPAFMASLLATEPSVLKSASAAQRGDKDFVLEAVGKNGLDLQYASNALREDRKVVLAAARQNFHSLAYASMALRRDEKFMASIVKVGAFPKGRDGMALKYASESLRNDEKLVSQSLGFSALTPSAGLAFQYASLRVQRMPNIALKAIRANEDAYLLIDRDIREAPAFRIKAIADNPAVLRHIPEKLWNNRRFAHLMLTKQQILGGQNGFYEQLSEDIRNDRSLVTEIARQRGYFFPEFSDDKEIALLAMEKFTGGTYRKLSPRLQNDPEIVAIVMAKAPWAYRYLPQKFRANREYALQAAQKPYINEQLAKLRKNHPQPWLLTYMPEAFRADRDIVLQVVKSQGIKALEAAAPALLSDVDFMASVFLTLEPFEEKGLEHFERLKTNKNFLVKLARYAHSDDKNIQARPIEDWQPKDIALALMEIYPRCYSALNEDFKNDRDIVLAMLAQGNELFDEVPKTLRWRRDIALASVQHGPGKYSLLAPHHQADTEIALVALQNKVNQHRNYLLERHLRDVLTDRETVLSAVRIAQNPSEVLSAAGGAFKGDREIAKTAVGKNGLALKDIAAPARHDPEIVRTAVAQNLRSFKYAPDLLKDNEDFVLFALKSADEGESKNEKLLADYARDAVLNEISGRLKADKPAILKFMQVAGGRVMTVASPKLQKDRELVLRAVQSYPYAILSVDRTFRDDEEIMRLVLKQRPEWLHLASPRLQKKLFDEVN